MLNMQVKENANGEPTEFIITDHDAAEFNSSMQEIMKAVTAGRQELTELIDWETDTKDVLAKSLVVHSGLVFEVTNSDPSLIVIEPYGSTGDIPLPDLSTFDNYLLNFNPPQNNTGAVQVQYGPGGPTKAVVDLDGNPLVADSIVANFITTIQWDESNDRFILRGTASGATRQIVIVANTNSTIDVSGLSLDTMYIVNGTTTIDNAAPLILDGSIPTSVEVTIVHYKFFQDEGFNVRNGVGLGPTNEPLIYPLNLGNTISFRANGSGTNFVESYNTQYATEFYRQSSLSSSNRGDEGYNDPSVPQAATQDTLSIGRYTTLAATGSKGNTSQGANDDGAVLLSGLKRVPTWDGFTSAYEIEYLEDDMHGVLSELVPADFGVPLSLNKTNALTQEIYRQNTSTPGETSIIYRRVLEIAELDPLSEFSGADYVNTDGPLGSTARILSYRDAVYFQRAVDLSSVFVPPRTLGWDVTNDHLSFKASDNSIIDLENLSGSSKFVDWTNEPFGGNAGAFQLILNQIHHTPFIMRTTGDKTEIGVLVGNANGPSTINVGLYSVPATLLDSEDIAIDVPDSFTLKWVTINTSAVTAQNFYYLSVTGFAGNLSQLWGFTTPGNIVRVDNGVSTCPPTFTTTPNAQQAIFMLTF